MASMAPDAAICHDSFPSGNCGFGPGCADEKHNHYQLILVDPPWAYARGGKNHRGSITYASMKYRELKVLPVHDIAERDCVLLLWSTGPFLDQATKLVKEWGFRYVTMFAVWRKIYTSGRPVCCPGNYTRSCHEFILLGTKGKVGKFKRTARLSQLIDDDYKQLKDSEHSIVTQRTEHSVKPQESFELIEEFFACERKIELFARKKQPGFDAWGLEILNYFIKDKK